MSDSERIAATRRIAASASTIFDLVTDPNGHVHIDGSGMLVAARNAGRLRNVGDTFEMDMDREPLGDLPMGKYRVQNTVTRIAPDAQLEWAVGRVGEPPFGHVYGYLLHAVGERETEVTSYCDWSGMSAEIKEAMSWPVVPVDALVNSLENLDHIVAERNN
ncbi:polyketide cyclase [Streptomyces sp. NPDC096311]|uniref:polyketide cyclase n=1 Tax=Streptomyces sp. NPDC096311 TaxID=3366083 RepID=UPI00382E75AE